MTAPTSTPSPITIDGPGSSGKSTIGQLLAKRLGFLYFDTGCLYRAVTAVALERNVDVDSAEAITALAETITIDVQPPTVADGRQYSVLVDGNDVTWALRAPQVDAHVSAVSAYPGVRVVLTEQMRNIGRRGNVVMVGRDIGTVVLPDAPLKLYLDASPEERARRRHQENVARDMESDYESVLASLRKRDRIDSRRATAPLRPAADAHIIDTTGMDTQAVLAAIEALLTPDGRPQHGER